MMSLSKTSLCLLSVLFIVGCKQEPQADTSGVKPPKNQELPGYPLVLDVPSSVEVMEGETVQLKLEPYVEKGKALISVIGLPEKATFDKNTFQLKWVTNFQDGDSE